MGQNCNLTFKSFFFPAYIFSLLSPIPLLVAVKYTPISRLFNSLCTVLWFLQVFIFSPPTGIWDQGKSLPIHIQWRKQEVRHREHHAAKLHRPLGRPSCLSFRKAGQLRPQAGSKRAGGWCGLPTKPWISSNTLKKPRHFPIICEALTHWAKINPSPGKWKQQHSTGCRGCRQHSCLHS